MTVETTKAQPINDLAAVRNQIASLKTFEADPEESAEALVRLAMQQAVVADLSSQALIGWEFENIMNAAVLLTVEVLGVEVCGILKRETSGGEGWRLAAGVGWPEDMVGSTSACEGLESQAGYTLRAGAPVVAQDLQAEERFTASPLLLDLGAVSALSVPMVAGRLAFGVMAVYDSKRRDYYEGGEVRFLETVANIITIAIVRSQAVKALRQVNWGHQVTRRYLNSLVDTAPDAIISTNGNGFISLFNKGAQDLLGYRREEIIGKPPEILYESKEQADEVVRLSRENDGTVAGHETALRAKDGSLVPVLTSASIVYNEEGQEAGTVAFSKDLRERKRWEEELKKVNRELAETSEQLAKLMEMCPDAIISTDAQGNVVRFNEGAEALLGYRRDEILGQQVGVLYDSEDQAAEVVRLGLENDGTVSGLETTLRAKDGSLIPSVVSSSILHGEDGSEVGAVRYKKDLRERKRWEKDLGDAQEEVQEAQDVAEQAQSSAIAAEKLAALGRLTAGVSHEVLNPISTITMRLNMMLDDPETPSELASHLRTIDDQANRIVKITENLLHFGRQRPPERRQIDLNDIVKRILDLLEPDLMKLNITVVLGLSAALPPVWADPDQVQQVLLNLLINARDAMPKGGQLALRTSEGQEEERFVELRVEDTGEGIDPESLESLFDPFYTTKAEDEGSGLGLYISRGIIEAHSGNLSAENRPGGGAAFVVRLPLRRDDVTENIDS